MLCYPALACVAVAMSTLFAFAQQPQRLKTEKAEPTRRALSACVGLVIFA
jgi:hypothetical protein